MDRQLGEAICIARSGGMGSDAIMNRKDEFSRCLIPEMEMKLGNTQISMRKDEGKRTRINQSERKNIKF